LLMRDMKLGVALLAVLFGVGTLLVFCPTPSARAADLVKAKEVFLDKCAKCHGESGKGDGPKAKTLKKKPADYTDKAKMSQLTDEKLKEEIMEGKKPMPSFKDKLDEATIVDLIAYIRTFAK
jgi:mono/diheme cytochrome c family protein